MPMPEVAPSPPVALWIKAPVQSAVLGAVVTESGVPLTWPPQNPLEDPSTWKDPPLEPVLFRKIPFGAPLAVIFLNRMPLEPMARLLIEIAVPVVEVMSFGESDASLGWATD